MGALESVSSVTLNFQKPNSIPVVYAKQGDTSGSRQIKAKLLNGLTPWEPPSNAKYLIRCKKPDRSIWVYNTLEDDATAAVTVNGSEAIIRLDQNSLSAAGDMLLELNVYSGEKQLTSFSMLVKIESAAVSDSEIEQTTEYSYFHKDVADAIAASQAVIDLTVSANYDATGPKVEKTGGSGSPYNFNFRIPAAQIDTSKRVIKYAETDTDTTHPAQASSEWKTSPPASPTDGKYIWTQIKDVYKVGSTTNTNTVYTYLVAKNGSTGHVEGAVTSITMKGAAEQGNVEITPAKIGAIAETDISNYSRDIIYAEGKDYARPSGGSSGHGEKIITYSSMKEVFSVGGTAVDTTKYDFLALTTVVQESCAIPYVFTEVTSTRCILWPTDSNNTFNDAAFDSSTSTYAYIKLGALFKKKAT